MGRKTVAFAGLGVIAALMTGCTDSAAGQADPTTDGELRTVRVAALPLADTGVIWAAQEAGVFARHGLDVEVVPTQGGAQSVPAMLSGDIEFTLGQPFSAMRADLQDLGVVIVGNMSDTYPEGDDIVQLVASADSGITSVTDLEGTRIGVNSIGSALDVTVMRALDDAGGDSSSIEFVEVAMPDAPAQLEAGNIDAAVLGDPFSTAVVGQGGRVVLSPFQATIPGLSVQVLMAPTTLLDEDPKLVADFAAAVRESLAWAGENEDLVHAALAENLGVPADVAATLRLSDFNSEVSRDDLEALAQIAVDYGVFERLPDFDRLIRIP